MYDIKKHGDLVEIFSHFKLVENIYYNICLFNICKIYKTIIRTLIEVRNH